jgi:hypothetical protein
MQKLLSHSRLLAVPRETHFTTFFASSTAEEILRQLASN